MVRLPPIIEMVMEFTFTDEEIKSALKANGWFPLWHPDNWVHESSTNPDRAGCSIETAFRTLLRKHNMHE